MDVAASSTSKWSARERWVVPGMLSLSFNADDLHRSTAAATRQEVRVVEVANTLFNRPHVVG